LANQLRIIGGEWRSRLIVFDDAPGLRPTPGRVRETLFNWLQADIANSSCLDLFAGSGALGFEAASRGAKRVVQVENHPAACQKLRENIRALQAGQIEVVAQDVQVFLQGSGPAFDLAFLDPPFGCQMLETSYRLLETGNWLKEYAKVYVEAERELNLTGLPANWRPLKHKTAGQVAYYLFQRLAP